ncbi:GFA family protein [Thalassotalea sp. PLHSN55]|uniref:GFA family protein n=1 Tax=Thalassotalea sp. PLHSN55 TaxID=3435888 RepID=UPI003F878867
MMANTASCLCAKIGFSVKQFQTNIAHCHCIMCQKFHGAAFSTFAEVNNSDLTWLRGQEYLSQYRAENDTVRQFCSCCGASLTFESSYNRQDNTIEVALAVFDQLDCQLTVNAHIFVRSKAPWLTCTDDVVRYQAFRK